MDTSTSATASETDLTYLEGAGAGQAEMNITNQGYQACPQPGAHDMVVQPVDWRLRPDHHVGRQVLLDRDASVGRLLIGDRTASTWPEARSVSFSA